MRAVRHDIFSVEHLEGRQMLSASHHRHHYHTAMRPAQPAAAPLIASSPMTVRASGSVLTVRGSTADERVVISQSGSTFTITNGTWSTSVSGSFTQLVVSAGSGNDSITIDRSVAIHASLYGGVGVDRLVGNDVGDTFYGGGGINTMVGGAGDDTFVTIGSSGDTVSGGAGSDSFWMGAGAGEVVTDLSAAENAAGHLHRVASYLNGRSLVDPTTTDPTMVYKNFSASPLFGAAGPGEDDINQGYLGDCYFLSALSAVAKVDADVIRQSIVALGDGTFAVQMHQTDGRLAFVRVGGDLPTWGVNGPLAYAGTGAGGGTWVALMEKAFTYVRSGANAAAPSYATIDNGGWMTESFNALGLGNSELSDGSASLLAGGIASALNAGEAVTVGIGNVPYGAPLLGEHAYTVDHVNLDSHGHVVSVTLRNPWGVDGAGNDGHDDGYVTVTTADLYTASLGAVAANV